MANQSEPEAMATVEPGLDPTDYGIAAWWRLSDDARAAIGWNEAGELCRVRLDGVDSVAPCLTAPLPVRQAFEEPGTVAVRWSAAEEALLVVVREPGAIGSDPEFPSDVAGLQGHVFDFAADKHLFVPDASPFVLTYLPDRGTLIEWRQRCDSGVIVEVDLDGAVRRRLGRSPVPPLQVRLGGEDVLVMPCRKRIAGTQTSVGRRARS